MSMLFQPNGETYNIVLFMKCRISMQKLGDAEIKSGVVIGSEGFVLIKNKKKFITMEMLLLVKILRLDQDGWVDRAVLDSTIFDEYSQIDNLYKLLIML